MLGLTLTLFWMKQISIGEFIWLMEDIHDLTKSKMGQVWINDSMTSEPASIPEIMTQMLQILVANHEQADLEAKDSTSFHISLRGQNKLLELYN